MVLMIDAEEWSVRIESDDAGVRPRVYLTLYPVDHDGKNIESRNNISIGFLKSPETAKMLDKLADAANS